MGRRLRSGSAGAGGSKVREWVDVFRRWTAAVVALALAL